LCITGSAKTPSGEGAEVDEKVLEDLLASVFESRPSLHFHSVKRRFYSRIWEVAVFLALG
jgi:hypothetical protein